MLLIVDEMTNYDRADMLLSFIVEKVKRMESPSGVLNLLSYQIVSKGNNVYCESAVSETIGTDIQLTVNGTVHINEAVNDGILFE